MPQVAECRTDYCVKMPQLVAGALFQSACPSGRPTDGRGLIPCGGLLSARHSAGLLYVFRLLPEVTLLTQLHLRLLSVVLRTSCLRAGEPAEPESPAEGRQTVARGKRAVRLAQPQGVREKVHESPDAERGGPTDGRGLIPMRWVSVGPPSGGASLRFSSVTGDFAADAASAPAIVCRPSDLSLAGGCARQT